MSRCGYIGNWQLNEMGATEAEQRLSEGIKGQRDQRGQNCPERRTLGRNWPHKRKPRDEGLCVAAEQRQDDESNDDLKIEMEK